MGFFQSRRAPAPPPPAPPAPAIQPPSRVEGVRRAAGAPKRPAGGTSARGVTSDAPIQYSTLFGQMRRMQNGRMM